MRTSARLALFVAALVIAACGGSSASPQAPSSPPAASPTPAASPAPGGQTYWLRMTTSQAIAPLDLFALQPPLMITGDGIAVVYGPVPAIFPGPLLPNLIGRQVSASGQAEIIRYAKDLGLLSGRTDFSGDDMVMGGITGHIELTVDGQRIELTGNPAAQIECPAPATCEPAPGSPQAFASLWSRLTDLAGWLGPEIGPEAPYAAPSYAILVGAAPQQQPGLSQAPMDWPLEQSLALFGGPVANGTARCGTVSGADADTLRPALSAANQLTQWVQDPEFSATFGLTVRPMVPGEDVCREMFGA